MNSILEISDENLEIIDQYIQNRQQIEAEKSRK